MMAEVCEVPRGTPCKGMRFNADLYQALSFGLKTRTRRIMSESNSLLSRGHFADLDLSSGSPDQYVPVSSLRCRMQAPGTARRSVIVAPRIQPGDWIWPRVGQSGELARIANATFLLLVTRVAARRLQDITVDQAEMEGVGIFVEGRTYEHAYDQLLGRLGYRRALAWRRGPLDQDIRARGMPTARDCFALLWETLNGKGSWAANPWVWDYTFRKYWIR